MSDSYITGGQGGTAFVGPDATKLFQAISLRSGLRLLSQGIRPSRGWTITNALATATRFTGKTYKRGQLAQAIVDLTLWIDTMRAALPVERS